MFLEVAFALGLVWIAPVEPRSRSPALVLAGAGVIATFTRSGLITMALSLLIYGGIAVPAATGNGARNTRDSRCLPRCSSASC